MKKYFALLLALAMVLSMLSGCAKDETPDEPGTEVTPSPYNIPVVEASSYKKDVILGTAGGFVMLDPHGTYNVAHNMNNLMVYNTLISWDPVAMEFKPELATEWKWKDDLTLWFKLREDVKFHNGEPMKASDFVFSFERCINGSDSTGGANIKQAKEIKAVGDYELEFHLKEANVDYLAFLALPYSSVLSEKALKDDPAGGMHIGTGPWVYVDMVEGDFLKLKRNENYWGEKPKTETLTIRAIPEASTRLVALQNGEIDLCNSPSATEIHLIEGDSKLALDRINTTGLIYFAFNTRQGPGADENFRLAIAHAVDKEEIVIGASNGNGTPAALNWGASTYGYDASLESKAIVRDLDKAKEYLAKTEHRKLVITCTANYKNAAELVQAQLKDIGVTVEINEVQGAAQTAMSKFVDASHEAMIYSLSWNPHGEDARRPYYKDSNTNKAVCEDKEIWNLIDSAKKEFDDTKRKEMYSKVQQINLEKCYYIPLYYSKGFVGRSANTGGIAYAPNQAHDFSYVCVAEK